jgi:hypothetical protein
MPPPKHSPQLSHELAQRIAGSGLVVPHRRSRYEAGDSLELAFTTVWPEVAGRGRFSVERFAGSGFAGQVYRCTVESLELDGDAGAMSLSVGDTCAVKIMVPASGFARRFRDALYWIGFQSAFSAQVNRAACRAGLLLTKLVRVAAGERFGTSAAVADVHASFYDEDLGSWGEIREWVEGRAWRLESDTKPGLRRRWRTIDPNETDSPEYVAKRSFMHHLVSLLHEMGAPEFARQYEWWTMKSQPNVMKRSGHDGDPAAGLCAVDFRAGLVLLPFLPMSPRDVGLIFEGIGRLSLVQFDRCDLSRLRAFAETHDALRDCIPMIDRLREYDRAYRRSMPDITHQGHRLLFDATLRADVRQGLAEGYRARGTIDEACSESLAARPLRFFLFQSLGIVPVLGRALRKLWGRPDYRMHAGRMLTGRAYFLASCRARIWRRLIEWHRAGRTGESETRRLADCPSSYWVQRLTIGFLPAFLHRWIAQPGYVFGRVRDWWRFMRRFYKDGAFREQWLRDTIETGHRSGMLHDDERDTLLAQTDDPYVAKYLKCVAVHLATLPVTQIISVISGGAIMIWLMASGRKDWDDAAAVFVYVLLAFQATPISPGSICRGLYVVYLMLRERDFSDYVVAAPLSFVKYIGYLAFPIQMATTYPVLSRFMASRWATDAVHIIPVFGEKGALVEHFVFDMFFNYPRVFGAWARKRMRFLLDLWLVVGVQIWFTVFAYAGVPLTAKVGTNVTLAVLSLFILPRLLFYPMIQVQRRKRRQRTEEATADPS